MYFQKRWTLFNFLRERKIPSNSFYITHYVNNSPTIILPLSTSQIIKNHSTQQAYPLVVHQLSLSLDVWKDRFKRVRVRFLAV